MFHLHMRTVHIAFIHTYWCKQILTHENNYMHKEAIGNLWTYSLGRLTHLKCSKAITINENIEIKYLYPVNKELHSINENSVVVCSGFAIVSVYVRLVEFVCVCLWCFYSSLRLLLFSTLIVCLLLIAFIRGEIFIYCHSLTHWSNYCLIQSVFYSIISFYLLCTIIIKSRSQGHSIQTIKVAFRAKKKYEKKVEEWNYQESGMNCQRT